MELPDINTSSFDKQALKYSVREWENQMSVHQNSRISDLKIEPSSWLSGLLVKALVPEFLCSNWSQPSLEIIPGWV